MAVMPMTRWLQLLRQIRIWLQQAEEIMDLPDLDDPQAVYAWLRMVFALAAQSAELTPTDVDDRVIAWVLSGPLASFDSFEPYYRIFRSILELVTSDEKPEAIAARAVEFGGEEAADLLAANPAGIDPVTIVTIIVQVIQFILSLRGNT